MKTFTHYMLLALCACALASANAVTEAAEDDDAEEAATTVEPELVKGKIVVTAKERGVSHLHITWEATGQLGENGVQFQVQSRKETGKAITTSEILPSIAEDYMIEDLATNEEYEVCVIAKTDDEVEAPEKTCINIATIKTIRPDSLLALFGMIAIFILVAIIAFICVKKDAYNAKKRQEEQEHDDVEQGTDGEPLVPNKSSIEADPSIPYITPRPEDLSGDDKAQYNQFV